MTITTLSLQVYSQGIALVYSPDSNLVTLTTIPSFMNALTLILVSDCDFTCALSELDTVTNPNNSYLPSRTNFSTSRSVSRLLRVCRGSSCPGSV